MVDGKNDEMIKALAKRLRTSPDHVVQKVQELSDSIGTLKAEITYLTLKGRDDDRRRAQNENNGTPQGT